MVLSGIFIPISVSRLKISGMTSVMPLSVITILKAHIQRPTFAESVLESVLEWANSSYQTSLIFDHPLSRPSVGRSSGYGPLKGHTH